MSHCLSFRFLAATTCCLFAASATAQADKPEHLKNDQLLVKAATQNGFGETKPWHVKAQLELTDATGKKSTGTFEEWWANPKSYKSVFTDDDLKQTDVATAGGLFRAGDQQWMTRQQSLVEALLVAPLSIHPFDPKKNDLLDEPRAIGTAKMRCVFLLRKPDLDERAGANLGIDLNTTPSYCFEPDSSILRYASGGNGREVLFMNNIVRLEGRNVAKDIRMLNGKASVSIHVLEIGAWTGAPAFEPAEGSTGPLTGKVVLPEDRLVRTGKFDADPNDLRELSQEKFSIKLEIGTDGHVTDATAVSGAADVTKKAVKIARKLIFQPFTILGVPVEVESIFDLHIDAMQGSATEPPRGRR